MHPAWGPYPETVLRFPEGDLTIDLRRPVSPHANQALAALGLDGPFAVVTASNPLGIPLDSPGNRRLGAVLAALVRERYPHARQADGASPDGTHVEPGWALPAAQGEARALAAQFFQLGMFWYETGRFSIMPILAPQPVLPLPAGLELPVT